LPWAVVPLPSAHVVFVFCFELDNNGGVEHNSTEAKEKEPSRGGSGWAGYVDRWARGDWSESSSNGEQRRKRRQACWLTKEQLFLSKKKGEQLLMVGHMTFLSVVLDGGAPFEKLQTDKE
jgi:hypothetical protein